MEETLSSLKEIAENSHPSNGFDGNDKETVTVVIEKQQDQKTKDDQIQEMSLGDTNDLQRENEKYRMRIADLEGVRALWLQFFVFQ